MNLATLSYAKGIRLENVKDLVEIQLVMATDKKSAENLAYHMFGENSPDLGGDLLGELVNMSMGTLRASFERESYSFTGGLPESVAPEHFYQFASTFEQKLTFSLFVEGIRFLVRLNIGSKPNTTIVPVASLREGMFIAKDVFNAQGNLLLKAGTHLVSTMVERLQQTLDQKHQIEVAWKRNTMELTRNTKSSSATP